LTQGKNNREIAERLALADSTVKVHIRNIVGKLPVKNRHHAAAFAVGNASATPYSPDSRSSAVSKGPDRSNGAAYSRRHPLLPVAGR
ncbi:MAG: response regulator transcription factor, partial [Dehalococcoidia bacterium]